MTALYWLGRNLPTVAAFAIAAWALVTGQPELALYFVLLALLFATHAQVGALRDELRTTQARIKPAEERDCDCPQAWPIHRATCPSQP